MILKEIYAIQGVAPIRPGQMAAPVGGMARNNTGISSGLPPPPMGQPAMFMPPSTGGIRTGGAMSMPSSGPFGPPPMTAPPGSSVGTAAGPPPLMGFVRK